MRKTTLLAIVLMVPLIFSSCSIFKPKPDDKASRYPEQIYKSQRTQKPRLSVPGSSASNPPFWYRKQRVTPETLPPETESFESLSTKTQTSLSKFIFEVKNNLFIHFFNLIFSKIINIFVNPFRRKYSITYHR